MAVGKEFSQDEAAQLRSERLVLFVLAAVQFTSIVDFMIVMPLGPQLMRALQIGPAEFGLIVSSYTFAAGAAGLVELRRFFTALAHPRHPVGAGATLAVGVLDAPRRGA